MKMVKKEETERVYVMGRKRDRVVNGKRRKMRMTEEHWRN